MPSLTPRGGALLLIAVVMMVAALVAGTLAPLFTGLGLLALLLTLFLQQVRVHQHWVTTAAGRWLPEGDECVIPWRQGREVAFEIAAAHPGGGTWVQVVPLTSDGLVERPPPPVAKVRRAGQWTLEAHPEVEVYWIGERRLVGFRILGHDPAWLVQWQHILRRPLDVRVVPDPLVALPTLRSAVRAQAGVPGGAVAHTAGSGGVLRELRPWQPGDGVRRVAWRAVARTGQWLVRVEEDEVAPLEVVLLDLAPSLREGLPARQVDALLAAASSLAVEAARQGARLAVEVCEEEPLASLPAGMGPGHAERVQELLVQVGTLGRWQPSVPPARMHEALETELRRVMGLEIRSAEGRPARDSERWHWLHREAGVRARRLRGRRIAAGFRTPAEDAPDWALNLAAAGLQVPGPVAPRLPETRWSALLDRMEAVQQGEQGGRLWVLSDGVPPAVGRWLPLTHHLRGQGWQLRWIRPWTPLFVQPPPGAPAALYSLHEALTARFLRDAGAEEATALEMGWGVFRVGPDGQIRPA
jgi:uncharacterized protein (DUF58 family)